MQAGDCSLLNSEALEYELSRIPDNRRQNEIMAVLALADERLEITDGVEALAELLESHGVDPIDAVHLALASVANVDFFVTCDDRLLRKSRSISGLACKVVTVLDLVQEIVK